MARHALQRVPAGTEGELCIAGPGVGRGYVNLPQKTKEKFVKDELGVHMYLAGDLARPAPTPFPRQY